MWTLNYLWLIFWLRFPKSTLSVLYDLTLSFLINPQHNLVSWSIAALNEAICKSTWVSIEIFHVPIEMLLVKSYAVEQEVLSYCYFLHTSNGISWELWVHYVSQKLVIWKELNMYLHLAAKLLLMRCFRPIIFIYII